MSGRETLISSRRRRYAVLFVGAGAMGALLALFAHALAITSFWGQMAFVVPFEGVYVVAALLWGEQPWKG